MNVLGIIAKFMEDHIPIRPDRSLLLGRQTSKWSLWDVVFHENNSIFIILTGLCHQQQDEIILKVPNQR